MNREEITQCAQALEDSGVVFERGSLGPDGNIRWHFVPGEGVIGRLLSLGWRVSLRDPVEDPTPPATLRVVP